MNSWGILFSLIVITSSVRLFAAPQLSTHAKASALGNAVTAEAVGIDSTAFNPATLTQIHVGPTGVSQEYKIIALPFPSLF
jgi:hypothetical protein